MFLSVAEYNEKYSLDGNRTCAARVTGGHSTRELTLLFGCIFVSVLTLRKRRICRNAEYRENGEFVGRRKKIEKSTSL